MERKIGETFEFEGKIYKTEVSASASCGCCDLHDLCNLLVEKIIKEVGFCDNRLRKDKNNVIFKEIKDNKLTINIPDGMEIDLQNSNFDTGVIKFKKKVVTYKDVGNYLDECPVSAFITPYNKAKLCAINRLMNIARFYNKEWKPDWENPDSLKFYIWYDTIREKYDIEFSGGSVRNDVYFKNKEDAQAVIDNPNFREILDAIFKKLK